MFTDVYRCLWSILTPPEALSFLLSCYVGGVGWGGAITFMFTCTHRIGYIMVSFLALGHTHTHTQLAATLWYLPLPLHNDGMLRYDILRFKPLAQSCTHTNLMLHYDIFFCACTILHACLMLRYDMSSCACTILRTHRLDATLWFFLLHLNNLAQTLDATLWHLLLHLHNLAHTHTLDVALWYLFWDRIYQWIFQPQFGQVTTDRQHEKNGTRAEETFVVRWSKHIIHEVAKREVFLYIEVKNAGVRGAVLPLLPCYRCL